jgi:hypothetical protein
MDKMRARCDSEVARRDKQIEQMQALPESRRRKAQCNGCMILEQNLEDLKKASQAEIQSLPQRILELLRSLHFSRYSIKSKLCRSESPEECCSKR